jgi:hypothetical protein
MFDVMRMEVGPHDVFVLKVEQIFSKDDTVILHKCAKKALRKAGFKNKIIILTQGASFSVIQRKAAA